MQTKKNTHVILKGLLEWTHLPEEFHVHFGDTVDGPGSLYGDIRGGVSGDQMLR